MVFSDFSERASNDEFSEVDDDEFNQRDDEATKQLLYEERLYREGKI